MKYEDFSFTVKYRNGEELINDVTAVIPNNDSPNEPYITFTDYSLDENNEFNTYYGKITEVDGQPVVSRDLTKYEILFIKDSLKDEIVKDVNNAILDNLEE